jgi:putative membrane protein
MKTFNKFTYRLLPVITGAAIGIAIIATTTATAQVTAPNTPPAAATDATGTISHKGKEFLKDAAQANQMEISLGDIALEKSQNKDVRDLAQKLRTDHQMNFAQLQPIARSHGVTLDSALSFMNQRSVNHLQKANDVDFDRDYTTMMIKDHVSAIKTFDKAVADVQEPDVKQYAESTLPTLRGHLLKAEKAARAVGVDQEKISSILKDLPNQEAERSVTVNP